MMWFRPKNGHTDAAAATIRIQNQNLSLRLLSVSTARV